MFYVPAMFPAEEVVVDDRFAEYLSTTSQFSSDTSHNYTSYSIGAADPTRRIFIPVHWEYAGGIHVSLITSSIAGQSATIHVQSGHTGGSTGFGAAIISALVTSGTSGTINLGFGGTITTSRIGGIRTLNMVRSTAYDTDTEQSFGSTADLFCNVNVPEFGLVIGCHSNSSEAGASVAWTGATERYDSAGLSMAFTSGLDGQSNRPVSIDTTPEINSGNALVVLSWN